MTATFDPYGEEYGDREDPFTHVLLAGCTGCPTCVAWNGKTPGRIFAERGALVRRRRIHAAVEPTAREIAAEDRAYWDR